MAQKIINVNIAPHGSNKNLVYITINTDDGEITIKAETIAVFVHPVPEGKVEVFYP